MLPMEKAYWFRFYPTPEQESLLRRTLGCVRLVYNKALHDRDINASKNILAAGLAVSVCRATIRPEQIYSVKAGAKPRKGKKQKPKS
jgi:transposase